MFVVYLRVRSRELCLDWILLCCCLNAVKFLISIEEHTFVRLAMFW